jgi:hypothetical protein
MWYAKERLPFTHSRDHQKNDNWFVEQKNGAVVREYSGYDRLCGLEEQALLAVVYRPLLPLLNFFMPTQKLKGKTRIGSKAIKTRYICQVSLQKKIKTALFIPAPDFHGSAGSLLPAGSG